MSTEETKVALMQQQIEYIKQQVDVLIAKLDVLAQDNSERVQRLQDEIDTRVHGVNERVSKKASTTELQKLEILISKKADSKDVEEIKSTIARVNWTIIIAVMGALLSLVII